MSEFICPNCKTKNSAERTVCEKCGSQLQNRAIIIRPDERINIAGRQLPAVQLKRIGASLVVSAAAILAEVGFIYLRRRFGQKEKNANLRVTAGQNSKDKRVQVAQPKLLSGKRVVSVYQEQVVEELRWGRPIRRIINRVSWRSEETLET